MQLGIGGKFHSHRLFFEYVHHADGVFDGIDGEYCAGDISEGTGDDFTGGEFFAVFAARPTRAKLIAALDLVESSRFGIVKLYRVRCVTKETRVFRGFDDYVVTKKEY